MMQQMEPQYRRAGGLAGGRSSDNLNRLRRWMEDESLSPRDRKLVADALGIVMNPDGTYKYAGGPLYKQPSGNVAGALVDNALGLGGKDNVANAVAENAFPSIAQKVAQAKAAGVPESEINKTLRNNAMKSRDARQRGALMSAALGARDATSRDQAGLITQAGLENRAYTPQGGAGAAVGAGLEAAGQAEAQYQGELSRIAEAEQARADELAKEEKAEAEKTQTEAEAFQNLNTKANDAIGFLNNGYKALLARQSAEEKANVIFGAAYLLPNANVAGIEKRQQAYIDAFMRKQVRSAKVSEDALAAINNLISVSTELTTTALEALGPGPKTDFDFIVAERSIANLEGTPKTIAAQFDRIRKNAKKWLFKTNQKAETPDVEITVPAGIEAIAWDEPDEPEKGWLGDKVDDVKAKSSDVIGGVIAGIKGDGSQENPYKVPVTTKRVTKHKTYEAVLDWIGKKDLNEDAYITYAGETGMVSELVERLIALVGE